MDLIMCLLPGTSKEDRLFLSAGYLRTMTTRFYNSPAAHLNIVRTVMLDIFATIEAFHAVRLRYSLPNSITNLALLRDALNSTWMSHPSWRHKIPAIRLLITDTTRLYKLQLEEARDAFILDTPHQFARMLRNL
jgi:hypothetical protein